MSLDNLIRKGLIEIEKEFDKFIESKNEKEEDIYIKAKLIDGEGARKIIITLYVDKIGNMIKKEFVKTLFEFEQDKERYFEELYKYVYNKSLIYLTEYEKK